MKHYIGVDLGGTHLRVGVVRGGRLEWDRRVAAHLERRCAGAATEEAVQTVLRELRDAIGHALEAFPDAAAVGLAVPGFVDPQSGRIAGLPNVPGVEDADLARPLERVLELPVVVENDALAAAWGAFQRHPERPLDLIFLGLGTGVGGGVILDGRPYRGRHGYAMEVGHIVVEPGGRACGCGGRGCLERYASASGVSLDYQEATGDELPARDIAVRARDGDRDAAAAFSRAGEHLAGVVATLMKTLDVTHVVVGGGMAAAWDLMAEAFDARLDEDVLGVQRHLLHLSVDDSGDEIGMVGAALLGRLRESDG